MRSMQVRPFKIRTAEHVVDDDVVRRDPSDPVERAEGSDDVRWAARVCCESASIKESGRGHGGLTTRPR